MSPLHADRASDSPSLQASLCGAVSQAGPVSFQRLYAESVGPEHPATPQYVANVLRSMNACGDLNPFKVRLRFGDGSVVVVKPKRSVA